MVGYRRGLSLPYEPMTLEKRLFQESQIYIGAEVI